MSTFIDFSTLPINVPSLCIPRVFPNITETRIRGIFSSLDMGEIEKVDIITKRTEKGEKFNRVFIHFRRWNVGGNADKARERLLNGKEIKIIYDDPWFWKISAFRERKNNRPSHDFKPVRKPVPRLQFDDDAKDNNKNKNDVTHNSTARKEQQNHGRKHVEPTTPPLAPPNEEEYHNEEIVQHEEFYVDYSNLPPPKKLNFKPKKVSIKEDEN